VIANSAYIYLAVTQTHSLITLSFIYGAAQFMFGFCNSAYFAFLMKQAGSQKYQATYFAMATAIMSLSFLLFGLLSGYLQAVLSYPQFFIWIAFASGLIAIFTIYFTQYNMAAICD